MSNNYIFCIHDNFPSSCKECHESKVQYCRCCGNAYATHSENDCPYKTHAAISSAIRPRACRALGCMDCNMGQTHYCEICKDNDANHRSFNCPLKSSMYCLQSSSQPQIAYVNRSQPVVVVNPPVVVVRNVNPQPIFVGIAPNPVVGFATSNGVFFFG